ncbi:MAG: DEAD/DEAH box helicase [Candidatus Kariarchaeaceae archaeon]
MEISELPIDDAIKEILRKENIITLHPPQEESIKKGVLDGENLVLAIPTASGKTLIAELAILQKILNEGGKAVYLSPLRALASEKFEEFSKYQEEFNLRITLATGDVDKRSSWVGRNDIIIATNEKFDSLLRRGAPWLEEVKIVVSDEVHLINDPSRGPTLEVVLAQIRYLLPDCQILCLSATINNASEIAQWLDAKLVTSNWRPVKLKEGYYHDGSIVYGNRSTAKVPVRYNDPLIDLAIDTVEQGGQALVFATTRPSAMASGEAIAKKLRKHLGDSSKAELEELSKLILTRGEKTKISERLSKAVRGGVAFHHAGLNPIHRKIVEDSFKQNKIKVITSTPTLCISKDTEIWHDMEKTIIEKYDKEVPLYALKENHLTQVKPIDLIKNYNETNLVKITTVSRHSIKVTQNHKMYIKRDGKKLLIPASEVTDTDKIATVRQIKSNHNTKLTLQDFLNKNETEVSNLKFDTDLSYFIGLMLGDGYSGAETQNGSILYKGSACIVNTDVEILQKTKEICRKLKLSGKENKNSYGTPQIIISKNKWFREFLVNCGIEKGNNKYISLKLMKMDLKNSASLLRGLFDTDGYVNKGRNIGFSNSSGLLIKQMQMLLYKFGIISRVRKRKGSQMQVGKKTYETKPSYELIIANNDSTLSFNQNIGFDISRKQKALDTLVQTIETNILYARCGKCTHKLYKQLFSGRTKEQKIWGGQKYKVIKLLGEKGELASKDIVKTLGFEPKKNSSRLNHHYQFIKKRKIGHITHKDWFWSLNELGEWMFTNFIQTNISFDISNLSKCPICGSKLEFVRRKNWRSNDLDGDVYWDIIRTVEEVPAEKFVYDVVLPSDKSNDHLFVANGIIVHNSAGINLPARRVIIRSLFRYSFDFGRNMPIPVLEFKQQAGRAGRPKYDTEGEALVVVTSEEKGIEVLDHYVLGEPEDIWSKLGSEPVLRTQVLALAASGYAESVDDVLEFINRTFYGFQNESWTLETKINDVTSLLLEEGLLYGSSDDFGASEFGKRVSELYIDPLSAIKMRSGIKNIKKSSYNVTTFSYLHLICNTPDMRNLFVRKKEGAELFTFVTDYEDQILADLPQTDAEWDLLLMEIKTAKVLNDWINELSEEEMHNRYGVGPGDLLNLTSTGEWLLNALKSFLDLFSYPPESKSVSDLVLRVKTGSKEELLDLVKLKGVGRVRARALYAKGFTSLSSLAKANLQTISKIPGLGKILAKSIIDQAKGKDPLPSKGAIDAFSELSSLISKEQTTLDDWLSKK